MEDLIAAIATGPVKSAVGIIRLSGEGAILCAAKIFRPLSGKPFGTGAPRRMVLGEVLNSAGSVTDQALAVFFCGPNSYTGEDMVELHCHGSPTVLAMTLELLCRNGARRAKAGEFTRRAFLNGKLDLTQAEAVADLIDAQTPAAAKQAAGQLGGELSRRIEGVYNDLTDLLAHFHVLVDYPDEDLEPMDEPQIVARLAGAEGALQEMLAGYRRVGRHLGHSHCHCGPAQRGEVLPAQRPAGLRAGHCHRHSGYDEGHGGGDLPVGTESSAPHGHGGSTGDG